LAFKVTGRPLQLSGIALLVVAALLTLRSTTDNDKPAPAQGQTDSHFPDYIVKEFTSTSLGMDGKPRYRLAATKLKHFADDGTSELLRPRYDKFPADGKVVEITANQGWMNSDETELLLTGDVFIRKGATDDPSQTTASMETLRIFPEEDIAETDSPVHLEGQNTVVDAVGMHADLANDRLTLLSKVHGKQEPSRP